MTCQPNCDFTGSEILPGSSVKAIAENSGTIWSLVKKPRSPPSEAPGSFDFFLASSAKSAPLSSSAFTAFASSSVSTRMWRAGPPPSLGIRFAAPSSPLLDPLHGLFGGRGLALCSKKAVHHQPLAGEGEALLEVVGILDLLVFRRLRHDLQVDQKTQHVVLAGGGVHLLQRRRQLLFGERD